MIWLYVCSLFLGLEEAPYVLVLKNNQTMEVLAAPTYEQGRCIVTLANGQKTSLPKNLVDETKTKAYNEQLTKNRKAAEKAAMIEEAERQAAASEPKPIKTISLERGQELPKYSRDENSVSGVTDGATTGDTPLAETSVRQFQSNNPVYVSEERIQRISGGNRIEYDIQVNEPTGASNVSILLKVNYENAPAEEVTLLASPSDISYGQTSKVVFRLTTDDKILRTNYSVSANFAVAQ